jgi:Bacterial Ig-like domain (group 3)
MSFRRKASTVVSKRFLRPLAIGVTTLVVAGIASVANMSVAQAAVVGSLSASPATGTDTSSITFTTSAACPGGTNIQGTLTGPGFPAAGVNVVGNTPISSYSTTPSGGLIVPLPNTMRDIANTNGVTTLSGKYDFMITCRNAFGATTFGDFVGSLWFTSNTTYQNTDPAAKTPTTTSLAVSPASPVDPGTNVTLTATVSPSTVPGSVQFRDGSSALGSPVTVSGGTASFSTTSLSSGTHSLTAVFTPSDAAFDGSTSAAVSYTVNAAQATPTTTSLAVSPSGTAPQFSPVSLTATVAPAAAAGSVRFSDTVGGTTSTIGTVAVSGGTATFTTSSLAVGDHAFSATFLPADTAAYTGSSSAAIPYVIGPFTGVTASETITTTVNAGALVISVDNPQVTLPSPVLNANGDLLTTSGPINAVTLTDTRAGNPGWTVNGQVTDFSDGATHSINGQNLGWTPNVIDSSPAQTVTAGSPVSPANGVAPGDAGTAGLKSSRTLALGTGLGTAHLGAGLSLNVPTSTVAGTYTATLTLTAI